MPEISVIVPVYKVEPYLRRCVDSILNQTFTDFELILVDDGSPDNCPAICDEYAALDPRVRVIHQENGGLSAARNSGLDSMYGDYVTFIDSDDYVYPEFLRKLYMVLVKNKADISLCRMIEFRELPPPLTEVECIPERYSGIQLCDWLCHYQTAVGVVAACGKLYAKEMFYGIRFPVGKIHEDQFVAHRLLHRCKVAVVLPDKLYGYYFNATGITKNGFTIKRYDNVKALEDACAFYRECGETELEKKAISYKNLITAMSSIYARNTGIYDEVLPQYRMSVFRAGRIIRKQLGYDQYEWHVYKCYPRLIKVQSYIRKLLLLFISAYRKMCPVRK